MFDFYLASVTLRTLSQVYCWCYWLGYGDRLVFSRLRVRLLAVRYTCTVVLGLVKSVGG